MSVVFTPQRRKLSADQFEQMAERASSARRRASS